MVDLDFKRLFEKLDSEDYVVIKLSPEFPCLTRGRDIDIFCRDLSIFSNKLIGILSQMVSDSCSIEIYKKGMFTKVDLLDDAGLIVRFDLLGAMPTYKNFGVKSSFFDVVIENYINHQLDGITLKVPHHIDDAVIRYFEYQECFASRPDKIKHVEYLTSNLNDQDEKEIFFRRLHYFTRVRAPEYSKPSSIDRMKSFYYYILDILKKAKELYASKGSLAVLKKIIKRVF